MKSINLKSVVQLFSSPKTKYPLTMNGIKTVSVESFICYFPPEDIISHVPEQPFKQGAFSVVS